MTQRANLAFFGLLVMLLSSFVFATAANAIPATTKVGDVIEVQLSQLNPTQPSIGYDQVFYKLGRFQVDLKKQFDEICEANGQKGLESFNEQSVQADRDSFSCKEAIGSRANEMKTVVLAPDNNYYLTDGHHTFNTFWHMQGGGSAFPIHVVVTHDYRELADMQAFWQAMQQDGNVWLFDLNNQAIAAEQLPTSLGMENFANDAYRSLMYFSRKVSWAKPKQPVPFLEFYWAKELKPLIDLGNYDLSDMDSYVQAITDAADIILNLDTDNLGGSGLSAVEMGQMREFKAKTLSKLQTEKGKLFYSLAYKAQQ